MAYDPNELVTLAGTRPFQKRFGSTSNLPKTFAAGTGTLDVLTPVAFNTSTLKWVVWANAGANGTNVIKGFVAPDPVVLSPTGEVIGQVLLAGRVDANDVIVPSGETATNLKEALRTQCRQINIAIHGLDNVR